jgi:hypothetical protein
VDESLRMNMPRFVVRDTFGFLLQDTSYGQGGFLIIITTEEQ